MEGRSIRIVEVSPRDGLQNEKAVLLPEIRAELVNRLADCGFPRIEAGSFVNPAVVPQMANAEAVFAGVEDWTRAQYSALVLNVKGAERALESKVNVLNFAFAVTESLNARNQNRTVEESLRDLRDVVSRAENEKTPVTATLGVAFGCPFEGPVSEHRVLALVSEIIDAGASEVILSDTIGVAVPSQVSRLVAAAYNVAPSPVVVGCHLHNTRNTGIANAVAAIEEGAGSLDASVGGAGGCPFAPGAAGNVASEDLLYLLDGMGYETGVNLSRVVETARWLEGVLGRTLPGMVKNAKLQWFEATT